MARTMVSARAMWRTLSAGRSAKASNSPKTSPGPSVPSVISPEAARARISTLPAAIR